MKYFVFFLLIGYCYGDCYMHSPRGSNNRYKETSANRRNANLLFDSQNNNRGGYNVGVISNGNEEDKREVLRYHRESDDDVVIDEDQFKMTYYASEKDGPGKSYLTVEFTTQHGCGAENDKLNSNIIIQYMCETGYEADNDADQALLDLQRLRNGNAQISASKSKAYNKSMGVSFENFVKEYEKYGYDYPMHESHYQYYACRQRTRNRGVFDADNAPGKRRSHRTRQNPGGTKHGMECPEERDYYPHWGPSRWIDIVLIGNLPKNELREKYLPTSNNREAKGFCLENFKDVDGNEVTDSLFMKVREEITRETCPSPAVWREFYVPLDLYKEFATKDSCESAGHTWGFTLDNMRKEHCFSLPPDMEFEQANFCRENHNGNAEKTTEFYRYQWKIPYFKDAEKKCVLRIRYNMTTNDYHPDTTKEFPPVKDENATLAFTKEENAGNNKVKVNIGKRNKDEEARTLPINVNRAQFGRTFQDRSRVFMIRHRPQSFDRGSNIHHVIVRGKRGNIVQVYPAVEYDFVPNNMKMKKSDYVCYQWTGSNTHNNGNPAGDGQAGDAGEGRGGTDRNNFAIINKADTKFPCPYEKAKELFFDQVTQIYYETTGDHKTGDEITDTHRKDLAVHFAYAGFYKNAESAASGTETVDADLNDASPSFPNVCLKLNPGTYRYMCTRNNNFSNRSQKGKIVVA